MLFCSDFNVMENIESLAILKDLSTPFYTEIRIAHVKLNKEKPSSLEHVLESKREDHFFGAEVKHSFKIIHSESILSGIQFYIDLKNDNDLVVVINHQKDILAKIFKSNHAKKMAFHSQLPLLVING